MRWKWCQSGKSHANEERGFLYEEPAVAAFLLIKSWWQSSTKGRVNNVGFKLF